MADMLIRNLPIEIIQGVKALAAKHKRSLQQEASQIMTEAVRFRTGGWAREADTIRRRLSRKGQLHSDSGELQREDRDR